MNNNSNLKGINSLLNNISTVTATAMDYLQEAQEAINIADFNAACNWIEDAYNELKEL